MIFRPEPYQDLMHDHMVARRRAGAFVGMGLGKTSTTLKAFHTLRADGEASRMLVVAPLRVATLTWPNEIRKWDFCKDWSVEVLRGQKPTGKATVTTINYERITELRDLESYDTVVFDELTRAKNPKSVRLAHLRPLLGNHRRWGLTGTPRPNSLYDLHGQIRLLDDGERLSPSQSHFEQTYFTKNAYAHTLTPKEGAEDSIYRKIHDLVITLKSSDYLEIPDTIVEDIEVPLPSCARSIYTELEKELLAVIGRTGEVIVALNAGILVNKLLQVCGGAVYVGEEEERHSTDIHDAKVKALQRVLSQTDENVIIAYNYTHERDRIMRAIPGAVDGAKFKGDLEAAWNEGKIKYLVAHPASLGHGLNLQVGGRTVVWFSPTWSREKYDQLNARLARKGQDLQPLIYRLVCPGTMDDVVLESLRLRGEAQTEMLTILTNFRLQKLSFPLAA